MSTAPDPEYGPDPEPELPDEHTEQEWQDLEGEPMVMPNETHDWAATQARMEKRLDEGYPPAWMHGGEVGAQLVGVVVGVKSGVPTSYGPCPVVTIAVGEAKTRYSLWLTHTVLRRAFVRQRPEPGELIAVRYEGEVRPESGGAAYENYTLVVDRPDEQRVDWDSIAKRYGMADEDAEDRRTPAPPAPEPEDEDDIPF